MTSTATPKIISNAQSLAQRLAPAVGLPSMLDVCKKANVELRTLSSYSAGPGVFAEMRLGRRPILKVTDINAKVARFVTAVGLGHLLLGHFHGLRAVELTKRHFTECTNDLQSQSAHAFAAELLMPQKELSAALQANPSISLPELAEAFNVTSVAMRWRLKSV